MVIAYADVTNPPCGTHSFPNCVIIVKYKNANNLLNLSYLFHEILCMRLIKLFSQISRSYA